MVYIGDGFATTGGCCKEYPSGEYESHTVYSDMPMAIGRKCLCGNTEVVEIIGVDENGWAEIVEKRKAGKAWREHRVLISPLLFKGVEMQ